MAIYLLYCMPYHVETAYGQRPATINTTPRIAANACYNEKIHPEKTFQLSHQKLQRDSEQECFVMLDTL